jgi:PRTRC genetic system protein C
MARLFVYDGREFPDPDPTLSVEDVKRQLAEFFPELANADVRQETRGEDTLITFARRIGTKGRRRSRDVIAILRRVPAKRLRILELVAELVDGAGEVDIDAAVARQPELNLAVAEAKAYARATERATEALRRLPAR